MKLELCAMLIIAEIMASEWLIFEIIFFYVYLGANTEIKDHLGRNFLHLTVMHSGGLQHLNEKFLQVWGILVCVC